MAVDRWSHVLVNNGKETRGGDSALGSRSEGMPKQFSNLLDSAGFVGVARVSGFSISREDPKSGGNAAKEVKVVFQKALKPRAFEDGVRNLALSVVANGMPMAVEHARIGVSENLGCVVGPVAEITNMTAHIVGTGDQAGPQRGLLFRCEVALKAPEGPDVKGDAIICLNGGPVLTGIAGTMHGMAVADQGRFSVLYLEDSRDMKTMIEGASGKKI